VRKPRFERIPMWEYLVMMYCWLYRRGKIIGTVTEAASFKPWNKEAEIRIFFFMGSGNWIYTKPPLYCQFAPWLILSGKLIKVKRKF
jgi:hypothetical protein